MKEQIRGLGKKFVKDMLCMLGVDPAGTKDWCLKLDVSNPHKEPGEEDAQMSITLTGIGMDLKEVKGFEEVISEDGEPYLKPIRDPLLDEIYKNTNREDSTLRQNKDESDPLEGGD